jgi:DNA end-binding protein Ku
MAAIWKGAISFGLVNISVELRAAVRAGGDTISFRQLHEKDLSPIHMDRVCTAEETVVPWGEIVKGYEYSKGKFVVVTDEEIKAAAGENSHVLEILDFVAQDEIDPRYFDTPYYVVPQKGGDRAYALLREAMKKTGTVGVGKFAMRQKEQLASIKAIDDALVLEVMRFATELTDPSELTFPSDEKLKPAELQMAEQLIRSLTEPFDASRYHDDYRENLMKVINAKLKGKKIDTPAEHAEPAGTEVIDLMERLRESLDRGKGGRESKRGSSSGAATETSSNSSSGRANGKAGARAKAPRSSKTA